MKITSQLNVPPERKIQANSLFLYPTTTSEIKTIINQLKTKKSAGIDGITATTLKEISDYIATPLSHLINKAIGEGEFPSAFKVTIVKPIHKSGQKDEVTNYRPISLITNLAKIFEKVIKIRIMNYLEKYNLLSDSQFGFRKGKSTQDAIACLVSKIYQALDSRQKCLTVFIDLKKAFDTVCHTQLINSLDNLGFRGNSLNLLKSYLDNRIQYTEINSVRSRANIVEYGVPQGTVLGPVLFILYINSLFDLQTSGSTISYADDTALFYTGPNWDELKTKVERDLEKIKNYFDSKYLTLNLAKTTYLPFYLHDRAAPTFHQLVASEQLKISPVTDVKYLGIKIDAKLKWDTHVNYVLKKLRKLVYRFKCLRDVLDINQLKILYHSLIESHLNYGILGWGGVLDCHLRKLDTLQKRLLKIIFKKEITYSSDVLFKEVKVMDTRMLYFYQCVLYQWSSGTHTTTSVKTRFNLSNNIKIPKTNTTCGQRCFTYLGPRALNSIPVDVKSISNRRNFKYTMKKFIIEKFCRNEIHNIINPKSLFNSLF